MVGYLLTSLLQIYCRAWWWKNFENRLAFRGVTGKNKVAPFFLDTVYVPLSPSSITWYRSKGGDTLSWEGDCRSGDALATCHILCGLSTYRLKANIREVSTPPKLTIGRSLYLCLPMLLMSFPLIFFFRWYNVITAEHPRIEIYQ